VPHYASLTWTASTSSNVAGYNVYRATSSAGTYIKLTSSLVAGTSYTDYTVTAGQTYYYVTTAVDSSGNESAYSNQAQALTPTP
jgi:fibronectin type 3 domain-containing protein